LYSVQYFAYETEDSQRKACCHSSSSKRQQRLIVTWVLPQASLQKSLDPQKTSIGLKKITGFKICASKFTILPEMI